MISINEKSSLIIAIKYFFYKLTKIFRYQNDNTHKYYILRINEIAYEFKRRFIFNQGLEFNVFFIANSLVIKLH